MMHSKANIKEGEVLFREGSFSDAAYIIASGKVEVSKMDKYGNKTIIGILQRNDIVGEMGLIAGQPRSATVTAIEDTCVSVISRDQFESLSKNNPNALMPILRVLSKRLRETLGIIINPPQNVSGQGMKSVSTTASLET